MKTVLKCSTAASMAAKHTVRISTYSSSFPERPNLPSEMPLLRVGRIVIKICSEGISKSPETAQVMSRRMLMAIIAYTRCCRTLLQGKNTRIARNSVYRATRFVLKRYLTASIDVLCNLVQRLLQKEHPSLFAFQFPSTLLIDTSLSLKDIVGLLMIRSLSIYEALQAHVLDFNFRGMSLQNSNLLNVPAQISDGSILHQGLIE